MTLRALILVAVSTPEQAADEKQSLDTQERELRAVAQQRGWQVIAVLRIPGFSRDYISFEDCAADMLAAGIPAMADLRAHIQRADFDVFMVRDADRFGRTQSLVMQIAETIGVKLRRAIYSQMDGLIEPDNCRVWAMMAGYRSAGEMDKKRKYYHDGMIRRAERGFHESATPWYHRTVHDADTGAEVRVEVRAEYRPIWDAVFDILVRRRLGFGQVETALADDYGIVNPQTGRPFRSNTFYELLCWRPPVWGARSRGFRTHYREHRRYAPVGEWVFDPAVPPPDGIQLWWNVFEPIYTGEQADALRAELRRRAEMRGGRRPANSTPFAGLLICDYCHHHLTHYRNQSGWEAYRCVSQEKARLRGHGCPSMPKNIKIDAVQAYVNAFLVELFAGQPLSRYFHTPVDSLDTQLASLAAQIAAVEAEADQLIARLGRVPAGLLDRYQAQLSAVSARLASLQKQHAQVQDEHRQADLHDQERELARLRQAGGVADLWQRDSGAVQQTLRRIFGSWRMVVRDGEIIGFAQVPYTQGQRKLD